MKTVFGAILLLAAAPAFASLDRYEVTRSNIASQRIPLQVHVSKGTESFDALEFRVVAAIGSGPAIDSLGAWTGQLHIPNIAAVPMYGYQRGDSLLWAFSIATPIPSNAVFSVNWISRNMPAADSYQIQLADFARGQRQPRRPGRLFIGGAGLVLGCGLTIAGYRVRRRRLSNFAFHAPVAGVGRR